MVGPSKAEIDSARESYDSSSPPLDDCILPLLPESIRERESRKWKDVRGDKDMKQRMGFYLLKLQTHLIRNNQTKHNRGEIKKEVSTIHVSLI